MKMIDLSHTITEDIPVFPGTPKVKIEQANDFAKDGFREKLLLISSHHGTHIDAPAHILEGGPTLDQLPLEKFQGSARVLDISTPEKYINAEITLNQLIENGQPEFILFYTGWNNKWGSDSYFENYPVLDSKLADKLAEMTLKGVGVDAISVDAIDSRDLPIHKILLYKQMVILENLTHLDRIMDTEFCLSCFPLKIGQADGSPVRAVAFLD